MRRRRLAGLVATVLSSWLSSPAVAAEPATKSLDLAYVTDDFFAAVVVHPARLLKSPLVEALPLAPRPQWVKERSGVELEQIEQAIVMLPRPGKGIVYQAGGIVRFREAVVNKGLVAWVVKPLAVGELTEVIHARKTYWTAPGARDMAAYAPDAKTLVFANEDCLKAMIDGSGPRGGIVERLRAISADEDVAVVAEVEPLRKLLGDLQTYVRGDDAVPVVYAAEIASLLKAITLELRLTGAPRFRAALEAPDDKSAELLNDLLRGGGAVLKIAAAGTAGLMKTTHETAGRLRLRAASGALDSVAKDLRISRVERRILVQCQTSAAFSARFAKLVETIGITQSSVNLRQLGLAMHLFHDTHGALPAHASFGKKGKPLLSWRVHLLPFMEMNSLHQQFRLDEPWDSPHNKKLIARMPPIFASPGKPLAAGHTCYLLPTGGDGKYRAIFGERPKAMKDGAPLGVPIGGITDGTSNTIMIVEVPAEKAVIWTKPDDWEVKFDEPKQGLFGRRKGFVLSLFADASVHALSESVGDEPLRRMIARSDGQSVELEEYVPSDDE